MSEKIVEVGDTVRFSFVGKFGDGSIFDTSDEPISIEIGTGKLIKGLDKEILGMKEGEEKEITVSPEEGYGFEDPNLITTIPYEAFQKNNIEPRVGMMLRTPQGDCHVTAISGNEVEISYNHPLAGKTLIFDIKIEEIIKKK
ncbi:FKBP-type peptidyl-prolyl cis-trans isomerase SlyD [bacterium HR37]|jgi:FKBP-type peptidyl-prolyl cis-trans isomerase 2|nr:FKBP-type peptidyl-prolyl cis-trans isomerase SlyD [bacterium HR37]